MYKKSAVLVLTFFLLSLMLSGCFRPASTPPVPSQAAVNAPTLEKALPQSTPQAGNLQNVLSQTQTAAAIPTIEVAQVTETLEAQVVTATPETTKHKKSNDNDEDDDEDDDEEDSSFQPELNPERPSTYTIKRGEWPICIARRYNLDVSMLLAANNLSMDSRPSAGTKLRIPQDGTWNEASYGSRAWHTHPTQYTIKSGDSFNTIACYFGNLLPSDIAEKNNMDESDKLSSGEVLDIP
jgi:LysM repeat protein